MIRGPPHRVSKLLAGSLRTSLTRALGGNRVDEVRALLEQGAEVQPSMSLFMPNERGTTGLGYGNYMEALDVVTKDRRMLNALVDGGWGHGHIAECIAILETYKTKMSAEIEKWNERNERAKAERHRYICSIPDDLWRWNAPFSFLGGGMTRREVHDAIVARLGAAMQRAMPWAEAGAGAGAGAAEGPGAGAGTAADERSRAASGVVPPGIDNASEVLDALPARHRQLSRTGDTNDDASFELGYMDLRAGPDN